MATYIIRNEKEKEEIVRYQKKHGWKAMLKKYNVSRATVSHWQERVRSASPTDKHPLARRYLIRPETVEYVKQLYKKQPDLSLEAIRLIVSKRQRISWTTIWHILSGR